MNTVTISTQEYNQLIENSRLLKLRNAGELYTVVYVSVTERHAPEKFTALDKDGVDRAKESINEIDTRKLLIASLIIEESNLYIKNLKNRGFWSRLLNTDI
jgi:hypothetical protein